jgi:hypothetical protein
LANLRRIATTEAANLLGRHIEQLRWNLRADHGFQGRPERQQSGVDHGVLTRRKQSAFILAGQAEI